MVVLRDMTCVVGIDSFNFEFTSNDSHTMKKYNLY